MKRTVSKTLACLIAAWAATLICSQAVLADHPSPSAFARPPSRLGQANRRNHGRGPGPSHRPSPTAANDLGRDQGPVQGRRLAGPTRAEPPCLGRATSEQLATFLADVWPKPTAKSVAATKHEEVFIEGMLASVPGGARLISAKDRKVEEQFKGNRYVGIHIALRMDDQEKRPAMAEVFEGGPADRAGAKPGDLIEQINDVDTKGMELCARGRPVAGRRGDRRHHQGQATERVEDPHDEDYPRAAPTRDDPGRAQAAGRRLGRPARWLRTDCLPADQRNRREHAARATQAGAAARKSEQLGSGSRSPRFGRNLAP